jgi:hypothetical protein
MVGPKGIKVLVLGKLIVQASFTANEKKSLRREFFEVIWKMPTSLRCAKLKGIFQSRSI